MWKRWGGAERELEHKHAFGSVCRATRNRAEVVWCAIWIGSSVQRLVQRGRRRARCKIGTSSQGEIVVVE
jgi:hypothetical protein